MKKKIVNKLVTDNYRKVKLVSEDGLKEMSSFDALLLSQEAKLDLVVVSDGDIPVCKIFDYKKSIYEQKKKNKEASKKSKTEIKEIRLGLDIGKNDLEHKSTKAVEFLNNGDILKISLRIKGWRNMNRKEVGAEKIQEFYDILSLKADIKFTSSPQLQGKSWTAIIENDKKKK